MKKIAIEKLCWSIALPGFGQLLNGHIIKGILFIVCEILINVQANFNECILFSFNGEIQEAIDRADYQWLMFYPCFYFYAMYDAFKDAGGCKSHYSFFLFVFLAYFVTLGLMFSSHLRLFGVLFGPVFLPMLFVIPGLLSGWLIQKIFQKYRP